MGIEDRDYMKDWRPLENWEPEPEKPKRSTWTAREVIAWVSIGLLLLAGLVIAILGL